MRKLKIGIIGGGVSGLGAAYELRRNAIITCTELDIYIFEKQATLGGNADTVVVDLGKWKTAEKIPADYQRWADLGVNDINLTAYKRIARIMKEIGYFDKDDPGANPKMMPLENTETYFTWDNRVLLTGDAELEHGVSNPDFAIEARNDGKFELWVDVIYKAADAVVEKGESLNINITVEEFFDLVIGEPKKTLEHYAPPDVDWDDPELITMLTEARDYIFYPRISAMYFTNDYGPEKMLLAAPMCYYRIQESKGDSNAEEKADRRYFVGGSNRWLQALKDNLLDDTKGGGLVKVSYIGDFSARVKVTDCGVRISSDDSEDVFDVQHCVVAVHADDAARLLDFQYSGEQASSAVTVLKILQAISYTRSIAVCHTYSGIMPANRNQWRSYNVLIRQDCSLKPYSMSYLCNRHQNDAAGSRCSEYNQLGLPQFFVTLNPQREIPDEYILRVVSENALENNLRAELPQLNLPDSNSFVYGRLKPGDKAVVNFKHNLIDRSCFLAQRDLIGYHKNATNLFFSGGWSNGSGLQEECWQQAERVAKLIIPVAK